MNTIFFRGRRLRRSIQVRDLIQETRLHSQDLIMPYFVVDTNDSKFFQPIPSMPNQYQLSLSNLEKKVDEAINHGLKSVILFGLPKKKDSYATEAYNENGIIQQAVRILKKKWPSLHVITDVCLCEYTIHGHCGLLKAEDQYGHVKNDPTLELLTKVAISHAEAGADMIAPSDMMDGRIQALRSGLDHAGFIDIPIMSYSAKYASAYYGPFREAAKSSPQVGDRKSYQMDPANTNEALREVQADINEGADIIMVKPAGPYQDIIRRMYETFPVPIAAYQVSGEYALIKAAGEKGWINEQAIIMESLIGIRRSGAKLIITYFTEDVLKKRWVDS